MPAQPCYTLLSCGLPISPTRLSPTRFTRIANRLTARTRNRPSARDQHIMHIALNEELTFLAHDLD